jgi:hypothetical protein
LLRKNVGTNKWRYMIPALGVSVCLTGALVMVAGESILGENHTGIAAMIGIVGICLVVGGIGLVGMSASISAAMSAKRSSKETKSSTGGA